MAWVRCCGGAQSVKPVAVIVSGVVQSGFSLSGQGMTQMTSSVRVLRNSSVNGGSIVANKVYTKYSSVQITAGSVTPAGNAYLRVQVAGKHVELSTGQTKTIALLPTDTFDTIACTIYNAEGTGYITEMTLVP